MADRKLYLGSSDAKHILSADWTHLYLLKTGKRQEDDLSDNFKVQLGLHTEDFHLDWTTRRLNEGDGGGYQFSKCGDDDCQHYATFSPNGSDVVLGSHPDALLRHPAGSVYPIEAKHTGRFRNADEAADFYMAQLQHHMLCWDTDRLLFSVIVGNEEPERVWIGASDAWQDHYIDRCRNFWAHVRDQIPPPPFFGEGGDKVKVPQKIRDTIPFDGMKKRSIASDNHASALIDDFLATKDAVKKHETAKKDLKAMMAEDEKELTHPRLTLARNKAGSILIKITDKEDA